jgi:hypothetical protein
MSGELQSVYSMSAPAGGLDGHLLLILAIMVVTGILGGTANYFLAERQGDPARRDWIKYPVFGVIAALTVPLFLNMISSTLLEGARTRPVDLYVFGGFCLIYVVASRRLFENVAQRLLGQFDQVRRDITHLQQKQKEVPPPMPVPLPEPVKQAVESPKLPEPDPREVLSYNDIEILRVLSEESFVYGNLVAICERTGLARDFVSQRLTVMKAQGVIETRINERNVLHWFVSMRGKAVLDDVLSSQEEKKIA